MNIELEQRFVRYNVYDVRIREALRHPSMEQREAMRTVLDEIAKLLEVEVSVGPVPMILTCPSCNARHIDEGEFATRVHHTHACQSCGIVWRPALVPTVGVRFLPGFKNG